jgi:hypothetical protein
MLDNEVHGKKKVSINPIYGRLEEKEDSSVPRGK